MNLKLIIVTLAILGSNILYAQEPSAADFNVYAIDNIGSSSSPYQNTDFEGIAGAGENIYLENVGVNQNNSIPESTVLFAGQNYSQTNGMINNGGIEVGGNITGTGLTIQGNVNGGGTLNGGSGTITGNVNLAGANNSSFTINGSVTQNTGTFTPSLNLSQISNYFLNANTTLSNMSQSSWLTGNINSNSNTLTISGLQSGLNIFDISLSSLNSANVNTIDFNGASNAIIVLNLTGTASILPSISTINGLSSDQILMNVTSSNTLTLTGSENFSILAPTSNLTTSDGVIYGNLIAQNLYGSSQVDTSSGLFSGFAVIPVSAPEPSTYLMICSFLGVILCTFSKKRAIS